MTKECLPLLFHFLLLKINVGQITEQTFSSCTSQPDVFQCLVVQTPVDNISRPSTTMTNVACESKLRPIVRSSMHPCPGNWVVIGRVVVYYVWSAHVFSAGIKCR